MPPDVGGHTVDVLLELPREARLADSCHTDHGDEPRAQLLGRGLEQLLDQSQLTRASDERRLEAGAAPLAAPLGGDSQRPPEALWLRLALQLVLAAVLEDDRRLRRVAGGVADQNGSGLGGGLDAGGGVDEVAGDHALVGGAQCDGCFAGEDAGAGLERGVEGGDRVDEVEGGADGALGVVLGGGGGAPDGHHGVADELLDGAAVALDDARQVSK